MGLEKSTALDFPHDSVDKNPLNSVVKNPLLMQATQVQFLSQEDPLEEEMATRCSILAWKIPVHGVPKVRRDLATEHASMPMQDTGLIPGSGRFHMPRSN